MASIRLPLRSRIALLVLIGALLAAAGAALLLNNAITSRNRASGALAAQSYLSRVQNVELLVVDAETGLRGYLLTGHTLYLAPLDAARAQMPRATAQLQASASFERASAQQLALAASGYLASYVPRALALRSGPLVQAGVDAATLEGKHDVDAIRTQADTLEGHIEARIRASDANTRHSASRSIAEAIILLVLLTALIIGLGATLGRYAITQQRGRLESERVTRALQQSMLPGALPEIPGCELCSRFLPAHGPVGGDFLDVFATGPSRWAIVLGDVCGKGTPAAALTAMARWSLRAALAAGVPAPVALRLLNDSMLRQDLDRRFVPVAGATVTVRGDGAEVLVACAGHPAPVLLHGGDEPQALAAAGTLLGVKPEIELQVAEARMRRGDSLVLFTDGLIEGDPGEEERPVEQVLSGQREGASAEQLCGLLERHAAQSATTHRDDVAILVLRFLGQRRAGARALASAARA